MIGTVAGSSARMMEARGRQTGSSVWTLRVLTVLGLMGAVAALWLGLRPARFPERIRCGVGVQGGTWDDVGSGLKALLEKHQYGLHVEEVPTAAIRNQLREHTLSVDPGGAR